MKGFIAAAVGATCALALTATAASAAIVCNREGDCWHAKERHNYRPEFGVTVYPDNWKWGDNERDKYRWREHEGRGYWHQGSWIEFN
ncbi:MAG: hypothetical protein WBX25_03020 [Rhodomicrobium sp.]